MKTMERILSFVLALCMLVSMVPVPASAAEEGVCTCVAICTDGNTEPQCALCSAEGAVLTDVCRYGDLYIKEAVFSDLFGSPMASWSMVESTHNELHYVIRFYKTDLEAGASPTDTTQGTLAVACSTLKNHNNYIDVSTKLPAGGNYFYTVYAGYNTIDTYENFIGNTVYSKVFTYESSKVALLYSWNGNILGKEHIQGCEPGTAVTLMTPDETTLKAPAGMEFAGWGVVEDGSIVTYQSGDTITLKAETTVTAQFREKPYYSVTIVPDGSGGGIPTGGGDYQEGDTVTLSTTLETEAGFCSMTWNVNDFSFQLPGTIFEPQLTVSFTMPARDVTITADYRSHTYVFENLGDGTHIQQCFMCDDPLTEAVPHVDADGDEACEDCGYDWHVHTLAESYEYDAEYHWRACTTCGTTNAIYEEHSFGAGWEHDGESHFHACVCGAVTDVTAHDYTIQKFDETKHWLECVCGETNNIEAHNGGEATCTEKARCKTCGMEYGPLLTHDYTMQKSDENSHWLECVCGETNSIQAHSGGEATCTGKALCGTCGVEYGSALGHAYDTLKSDGLEHWWECVCGEKSGVTAHFGGTAACDAHPVCETCGTLYGERLPHNYDTKKFDQEWHWWECECGERFNLGEHYGDEPTCDSQGLCYGCDEYFGTLLPHDYVNLNSDNLDHWMECACGERAELIPHSGGTATCTEKARCETCGAEYGKLKDHDYATQKIDAESHWMECTCGEKSGVTPHFGGEATCTTLAECEACGKLYGRLKDHDYAIQKSDDNVHWTECVCGKANSIEAHCGGTATCTEKAKCETCGIAYGALTNHVFAGEWHTNSQAHWKECACGQRSQLSLHQSWQGATLKTPEICNVCSYEMAPRLGVTLTLVPSGTQDLGEPIASLEDMTYYFLPGTVVDLSEYWPEVLAHDVDGTTYYFHQYGLHGTGVGSFTITMNEDTTLYAGWVTTPVYTITLDTNGGSLPYAKIRDIAAPMRFTNQYHIPTYELPFLGWGFTKNGQPAGDDDRISGDCTLYAIWDIPVVVPHEHTAVSSGHNDREHWSICGCGESFNQAPHSGGTATCTEQAKCSVCGTSYGDVTAHSYTIRRFDESDHWMECECGDKADIEAHAGGEATCTEQARCQICGTAYGDLSIHIYSLTWHSDETNHWQECSCGKKTVGAAHSYGNDGVCPTCGYQTDIRTLTIHYANKFFDPGLGTKTIAVPYGATVDLSDYWPEKLTYTENGQTWNLWDFTASNLGGETYSSVTMTGDMTLYAGWVSNDTYTITLDPQGGTLPVQKVRFPGNTSLWTLKVQPTVPQGNFLGWAFTPGGPVLDGQTKITEDCTLYAISGHTLTIHYASESFDPGLGTKTIAVPYGATVDLSSYWPEQLEYTENGKTWYLAGFKEEPDGFVIHSATTMTGDKTLRASWVTNPQGTVTFDPQGGSMDITKMRCTPGSYISLLLDLVPAPTREGYAFLGWSLTPEGAVADENTKLQADTTLYAVWGYSLTLTFPRTSLPDQVYSFAPGTVVDLSDYWPEELTQQIDGETRYFGTYQTMDHINLESLTMDTSVTLRAFWRGELHFTVTLDPQGGTIPWKRIRFGYSGWVDRLRTSYPPNDRPGFTFLGWAATPNGTPNQGRVNDDCTLYAIWQENAFTVGGIKYRIESENTVSVQSATLNAGTTILEIPADVVYGGKRYTVASLNANAVSTGISTSLTAKLRYVTVYHLGDTPHIWGNFPEDVTVNFVEIWNATPSGLRWNAATKTLAWDAVVYDPQVTSVSPDVTYEVAVYNAQTGMRLSKKTTSATSASFANLFAVTNKSVYFSVTAYNSLGKPSRTVYSNQESLPQTYTGGTANTATVGGEQVTIRVMDSTAVLDDFVTIGNTVVGVADTGATGIQVGKIATSQAAAQSGQAIIQLAHGVTLAIGQSGWQALDEKTGEGQRVSLGADTLGTTDTQAPKDGDVFVTVNLIKTAVPSLDMEALEKIGVVGGYDREISFADLKLLAVRALHADDLRAIARLLTTNAWLVTWCNQQADRADAVDKLYCEISPQWLADILCLDQEQLAYVNRLPINLSKVKLEVGLIKDMLLNTNQLRLLSRSDAVSGDFKAWLQEAIAGEPGSTVNVLGGLGVNYTIGGSPVTITGGDFQYGMNLTLPDGVNPSQVSGFRLKEDGSLSPREVTLTPLSGNLYRGTIRSDGNSTYVFVCESTVNLPPIPEHTHSYTIQKHDSDYHWMECECGEQKNTEAHSGGEATCTEKAKCEICGAAYSEAKGHGDTELRGKKKPTCTQEGYTGDRHCIACGEALEAGEAIPATGHSYVWKVDKEATTTQTGLKHEECTCGARRSENTLIPQLTTPATGDDSQIALWSGLVFTSGLTLALLWLLKKREYSVI